MKNPQSSSNNSASSLRHIEKLHREGHLSEATTLLLEQFGAELFGFLMSLTRSEPDAAEVFSQLNEDLWRGFPKFRWECSLRTWLYTLARNAYVRQRTDPYRRRKQQLSDAPHALNMEDRPRTQTRPEYKTESRNAFEELRNRLDTDEQMILTLRIDRGLSWNSIAAVIHGSTTCEPVEQRRMVARLRKRFERIKVRLRRWAEADGLLEGVP